MKKSEDKKAISSIGITAILAIFVFVILAFAGTASAETFTVNETGWWNETWDYNASSTPIQAAIDNATAGDTINVAAGTYNEQVVIDKALTLQGAGDTTIIQPTTIPQVFNRKKVGGTESLPTNAIGVATVNTETPNSVTIKNLMVDGSAVTNWGTGNKNVGIFYQGTGGVIDNVTLDGGAADTYGDAIYVSAFEETIEVEIGNCDINGNFSKNGITCNYPGLTASIHDNTVAGSGPIDNPIQNGIQIGFGATGTISNNTVSNNCWTGQSCTTSNDPTTDVEADGAAGILLYHPSGAVEVNGNTLTGNQFGVWSVGSPSSTISIHDNSITGASHGDKVFPVGVNVYSADQWTADKGFTEEDTAGSIYNNTLHSNDYGILVRDYTTGNDVKPTITAHYNDISGNRICGAWSNVDFDATNNWWGDASGPGPVGPGSGDNVSNNVTYDPWLMAPWPSAVTEETVTETIDGDGTMPDTPTGGNVTINATGNHTITTAKYAENPGGEPTFKATGDYWDVHLDNATNVTNVTIEFCPADPGDTIYYWNATSNSWKPCSDQAYADGCITVTITGDTEPSLDDLTGQEFGRGRQGAPEQVPEYNAIGLLALIGILSVVLAVATLRKRG